MKDFEADYVVHIVQALMDETLTVAPDDSRIADPAETLGGFDEMTTKLHSRGLTATCELLERIRINLSQGSMSKGSLASLGPEIIRRIQYDMKRTVYLRLEEDESDYFNGRRPNWGGALTAFPIEDEVIEGSKCFALERYPATVFHMMRVLEVGLNALAAEVGVSFEHRNWDGVLVEIENRVKDIDKSQPSDDSGKQERRGKLHFYSEVCRHFRFLKDAWRNYAMHVKEAHDHAIALSTLVHVSEFMKQLAGERPWTQRR